MKTNFFSSSSFVQNFFLAVCVGIIIDFSLFFFRKNIPGIQNELFEPVEEVFTEALQPVAFRELTIPFLREKTYKSSLGDLEKVSETPSYTTYLTSYVSDGLKINGLLTQPKGEKPVNGFPAIVFIHGYIPPTFYKTQEKYVEYVNTLAKNGFVVFKIDLRGHADSEGDASGSYYSSGYVIDTLNARAALQSTDFVNKNAIGLWGHSMAGNIVMRSFAAQPDIPAVVIWAGAGYTYQDLQDYGLNDNSYRPPEPSGSTPRVSRQQIFEVHGSFNAENEFWKQVVPTNYLHDLKGAIQLHHAKDDEVVDSQYSQNLQKLLNEASVPNEVYFYSTGGHNISGSNFSIAMQRTVDFYKKYLLTR